MASVKERMFAGFGAVLFLITACGLTIFAIMDGTSSDTKTTNTAQTECKDDQTETSLAVPDVYKSEGDVTELQVADIEQGDGAVLKDGDCAVMKYYGTLASSGEKFDENFTDTTGFAFKLGAGNVIQGWDKGLAGMKVGGVRRLVIPSDQAYGSQAVGTIPADSDLVFVVKLLRIKELK